jgi:hypothetical protein
MADFGATASASDTAEERDMAAHTAELEDRWGGGRGRGADLGDKVTH